MGIFANIENSTSQSTPTKSTGGLFKQLESKSKPEVAPKEKMPDLGSRLATDWTERGKKVSDIISNKDEGNSLSRGFKIAGQAFGGVGDIFSESFKSLFGDGEKTPEQKAKDEEMLKHSPGHGLPYPNPVEALAKTDLFKGAADSGQTKKLENTLGAVSGAGEVASNIIPFEATPKTGIDTAEIKTAIQTGAKKTADFIDTKVTDFKTARKAREASRVDNLVGNITQGKTAEDIAASTKAIGDIDVSNVKTYKDLGTAIDDKIGDVSGALDKKLLTNTESKKLGDLATDIKVGDKTVSHNYVEDSVKQLKDHYTSINDQVGLEKIKQLEAKALDKGLTVKEINDLAKLHGRELNAFNANGQAASGLTKQAAENTRTGLKTTARKIFGDKAYEAADKEMANLLKTRKLVTDMEKKVQDLTNRIQKRGLGQKLGRTVANIIDTLSGHSIKGAVEYLLPRGQGYKVMNALDLEKALQSNLKKVQRIIDDRSLTEAEAIKKLEELE